MSQPEPTNQSRWLVIGALGCAVICGLLIVVAGGAYFLFGSPFDFFSQSPDSTPRSVFVAPTSSFAPVPSATTRTVPAPIQPAISPTPTPTRVAAASTGKIAFSVARGDRPEDKYVFIMNADGTGVKQILDRASEPTFSPDGSKIAYYHWTDGIYIANADGANQKKILGDTFVGFIEWSHKGDLLAISAQPGGQGNIVIEVITPEGANRRLIVIGESPAWSPDDSELIFHTCRDNRCGIYKARATGGDAVALTTDDGGLPVWSPDGKQIIYQKDVDGVKQLFSMNADGSNRKQITFGAAIHVDAVFSSDGRFIFYRATEGGTWGIWRMNADATNPIKLIDNVPPVNWPYERLAFSR